jgi:carbamoyl-phosphate synthase large subunit
MAKLRLLVLSVGTRVGQNVLAVLAGRRDACALIATSSVANEPALFDCDAVHLVPETAAEPEAFERALLRIVAAERIDLVIPCRDDDVVFLGALRDRRAELGRRLLCGGAEAAQIIADKWLSAQFSLRHGLPFVPSIADSVANEAAAFAERHGFPLIAKPRRGYASQDVYIVCNGEQLERTLGKRDWIVQQFLGDRRAIDDYLDGIDTRGIPLFHSFQGLKHSIQALIDPDGAVAHVICTCNASRLRRSKRVEPDTDPEARAIGMKCAQAFSAAGWRGPLNIQCQRSTEGELLIHEFNGRFTGATVERWLLGYDEVGAAIAHFTGVELPSHRSPSAVPLEAFEAMTARAADPRCVAALARDRTWRRP